MRSVLRVLILLTLAVTPATTGHAQNLQDHQYTSADIQNGARLYAAQCALCHGPTGDGVSGIDLRRGVFRRVSSDQDIAKVLETRSEDTRLNSSHIQKSRMPSSA